MIRKLFIILPMLILVSLSGCHTTHTNDSVTPEKDSTKNTSINDDVPAVSAVFKNSKTTEKTNRFENDYMRVWKQEDKESGYGYQWMQENIDGTEKEELPFGIGGDFLWLTNGWLYYYYTFYEDDYFVCRIPVENKDGVTYDADKKETLFREKGFRKTEFMVLDTYIIYGINPRSHKDDTITYYSYDFNTQEQTKLFDLELVAGAPNDSDLGIYSNVSANLPVILGNSFFVGGKEGVYRVPFDTLCPVNIYAGETTNFVRLDFERENVNFMGSNDTDSLMVVYGNAIYFTAKGTELMKYEEESETASCILPKEDLWKVFDEMKLWDEDVLHGHYSAIEGLFIYNDRLYINVIGNWEKLSSDKYIYSAEREVLLSADISDLKEWKLEKTLSDYILRNATCDYLFYWSEQSCESKKFLPEKMLETETKNTLSRACYLYDLGGGKVLVSYFEFAPHKKPDGTDGIEKKMLYDLGTGEILSYDTDDPAYYQRQWREVFYEHWPTYLDEYTDS